MLNDATGFDKIFIATGYTDLRRGIDGLASTIKYQFELDPFQKNILFLFCGKRTDRIKGLKDLYNSDIGIKIIIPIFQLFRQNCIMTYFC